METTFGFIISGFRNIKLFIRNSGTLLPWSFGRFSRYSWKIQVHLNIFRISKFCSDINPLTTDNSNTTIYHQVNIDKSRVINYLKCLSTWPLLYLQKPYDNHNYTGQNVHTICSHLVENTNEMLSWSIRPWISSQVI